MGKKTTPSRKSTRLMPKGTKVVAFLAQDKTGGKKKSVVKVKRKAKSSGKGSK
jgi:hypothetical protein